MYLSSLIELLVGPAIQAKFPRLSPAWHVSLSILSLHKIEGNTADM